MGTLLFKLWKPSLKELNIFRIQIQRPIMYYRETIIHTCIGKIRSDSISICRKKPLAQASRPITRLVHHVLAIYCFEYAGMWILRPY